MKIYWFLIKNYFKLSKFMDVRLGWSWWEVDQRISYSKLNSKQKQLSDDLWKLIKEEDLHIE